MPRLTRPQLVHQLYLLAREVRVWGENIAEATGRGVSTLSGLCVITAYEMFARIAVDPLLKRHSPIFAKSDFHAFVLVDGLIVDVTATQFRNTDPVDGVWIVDLSDEPESGVWAATKFAASKEAILALDCWLRWLRSELPLPMQTPGPGCPTVPLLSTNADILLKNN
jgi:hypothetical protein